MVAVPLPCTNDDSPGPAIEMDNDDKKDRYLRLGDSLGLERIAMGMRRVAVGL